MQINPLRGSKFALTKRNLGWRSAILLLATISYSALSVAENRIDTQRPDAPELATYGTYDIGVKTLHLVNPVQIDMLQLDASKPKPSSLPTYDRPLTVEVWYPARENATGETALKAFIRDGKTQVALHGKARRDASPIAIDTPFPLVLVSHGYPGNRFLLSHLAENIASKGYVVVSIDHTDSTYRTQAAFASTLVNRPVDQQFVLDKVAALSNDVDSFLYKLVNADNTALIGYSMGGYGALITAGASVTEMAVNSPQSAPFATLKRHQAGYHAPVDSRLKTVIAFAPWGMNYYMFSPETLSTVSVPMMLVAGSQDDVSGYENGVRAIWQGMQNTERALLTYENANHNAGAVMPAPEESFYFNDALGFNVSGHYIDAVWDNVRMNNIAQHFVTAWLGKYLKEDTSMQDYLNLVPHANEGVWAMDEKGMAKDSHTYWKGFQKRTAKGLSFEYLAPYFLSHAITP